MLDLLVAVQTSIRSGLGDGIEAFAVTYDFAILAGMLPLAVLFGTAHAMTPGHGKSLLAVYAVGSDLSRLRIIGTALALTLTHIGMAVVLALVANTLITRTIVGAGQAPALELASRLLLVGAGVWLILRAAFGSPHVHGEGILTGVAAGLIPCPLTLFLMFFATSRGVPEAGLTFAAAMAVGVGLVLTIVAVASVWGREIIVALTKRYGVSLNIVVRLVDGVAGAILIILAATFLLN